MKMQSLFFLFLIMLPGFAVIGGTPEKTQAEKVLEIQKKVSVQQSEILYRQARELQTGGEWKKALRLFENYLILYPAQERSFDSCYQIAQIFKDKQDYNPSIEKFMEAYKMAFQEERGFESYLQAGRLYREMGDFERARAVFSEILGKREFSKLSRIAGMELNTLGFLDLRSPSGDLILKAPEQVIPDTVPKSEPGRNENSSLNPLDWMGEGLESSTPASEGK